MKKNISIIVIVLLALFALYHSVYFEKLNVKQERESIKGFNPSEKVDYLWSEKLVGILESALDLKEFDSQLKDNLDALIHQHGKAVGITSTYCFLVKGQAVIVDREADVLSVEIPNLHVNYNLQIKYIFGNTARDAVNYFDIADFENTMDFNAVATEMNRRILEKEVSRLDSFSSGDQISFVGAVAVNVESVENELEIIPLKIEAAQ